MPTNLAVAARLRTQAHRLHSRSAYGRQVAIRNPETCALVRYRKSLADVAVIAGCVAEDTSKDLINSPRPRNHSSQEVIPEIWLCSHEPVTLDQNIFHMRPNQVPHRSKVYVPYLPYLKGRCRSPMVTVGGQ